MLSKNVITNTSNSEFLAYLILLKKSGVDQLPSLSEISKKLNTSIARLREQMEVARSLGIIEVKPKTGIKILPYKFSFAVLSSVSYSINIDPKMFHEFRDLRNNLEKAYWYSAASKLKLEDFRYLRSIVKSANRKLSQSPILIPDVEHRELHLTIFKRLDNAYVNGILEAYWELYDAVGLNFYEEKEYLEKIWSYHERMVEALETGDFNSGYQALITHMGLIDQRKPQSSISLFE